MTTHFHLFVYGTLRGGAPILAGAEFVRAAAVAGTLYDIEGRFPALMAYGTAPVTGEIWRCPANRLAALDEYEGVAEGLFRRIALDVDGLACWLYVAGPALASKLVPTARIESGDWLSR